MLGCYRFTSSFPKHETYGLVSQMRRAAVSIAANIAEGFRKRHRADKCRFASGFFHDARVLRGRRMHDREHAITAMDEFLQPLGLCCHR